MARRPTSTHRGKTKQQLVEQLNKQTLEQYSDYGTAREKLGRRLMADIDQLYNAAWFVIMAEGLTDRQARYLMVKSLLDKIAPDRREHTRADVGSKNAPVLIQVNGLNRGTVEARDEAIARGASVVTIEAETK